MMHNYTLNWLLLTLFCILAQGFYSMFEMAAVSFNRVRLQYYVSKGVKRAIWLQNFIQKPSRLFGTVMLGVNIALQLGSQSSREFYASLNLDPDLAPVTQVFLVVILGELAPLFAARRYAEHAAMLGIPIIYITQLLFTPLIWIIDWLSQKFNNLIGLKNNHGTAFLTREELQIVIENQEENLGEKEEFNVIVANIFSLRNKTAKETMIPLNQIEMLNSTTNIQQMRLKLATYKSAYVPIFHKHPTNVVAMAFIRDMIKAPNNRQVRDFAKPPWFITQDTLLVQTLSQFKKNNQHVAIVLNPQGLAIGILTLERILSEIFGSDFQALSNQKNAVIERSFPGNLKIDQFNLEYGAHIDSKGAETFAQLMFITLGHHPEEGESIIVDRFEIRALETTLRGIKTVIIKSLEA